MTKVYSIQFKAKTHNYIIITVWVWQLTLITDVCEQI